MAGETHEIRREIAETREEIDAHLQELGGRVERTTDVRRQIRENLPQVLAGAAVAGLALGILVGRGGGRHRERSLMEEELRLAKERGRLQGVLEASEFERGALDVP